MSGAQAKAAVIAGAVCVVAEINPDAAHKRHEQGWVDELETDLAQLVVRVERARTEGEAVSIAYVGNIVDLLEYMVEQSCTVHLGNDQTSLHLPEVIIQWVSPWRRRIMMSDDCGPKEKVYASLRHVAAVNTLVDRGMYFWDYGNAFLLESSRAGRHYECGGYRVSISVLCPRHHGPDVF